MGFYNFPQEYSFESERLEFEPAYYDSAVQRFKTLQHEVTLVLNQIIMNNFKLHDFYNFVLFSCHKMSI